MRKIFKHFQQFWSVRWRNRIFQELPTSFRSKDEYWIGIQKSNLVSCFDNSKNRSNDWCFQRQIQNLLFPNSQESSFQCKVCGNWCKNRKLSLILEIIWFQFLNYQAKDQILLFFFWFLRKYWKKKESKSKRNPTFYVCFQFFAIFFSFFEFSTTSGKNNGNWMDHNWEIGDPIQKNRVFQKFWVFLFSIIILLEDFQDLRL